MTVLDNTFQYWYILPCGHIVYRQKWNVKSAVPLSYFVIKPASAFIWFSNPFHYPWDFYDSITLKNIPHCSIFKYIRLVCWSSKSVCDRHFFSQARGCQETPWHMINIFLCTVFVRISLCSCLVGVTFTYAFIFSVNPLKSFQTGM